MTAHTSLFLTIYSKNILKTLSLETSTSTISPSLITTLSPEYSSIVGNPFVVGRSEPRNKTIIAMTIETIDAVQKLH